MKDISIDKYIPKKHQHKIESFYKDIDGCWLNLNENYISIQTESSSIHENTINEVRSLLNTIMLKSDFDKMTRKELNDITR